MILLDHVVQILDLPDLDGCFPFGIDGPEGSQIGPAFIHGHGLRRAVTIDGYVAYSLSLRDLEEMMAERGFQVDHSSVHPR
jgi:hypothetical protein